MSNTKNSYSKFSDSELVSAYKNTNDKNYVGELYKRYSHLVLGMCISILKNYNSGEEAMLIIFERLFDDLKKYEIVSFKSWLTAVVYSHCFNELRKRKSTVKKEMKYESEIKNMNSTIEEDECFDNLSQINIDNLFCALSELKYFQKQCVELFYLKKMSYSEVAESTGLSMDKVKSNIQNGKRNLKLILTNKK